jgi:hypothetical protein
MKSPSVRVVGRTRFELVTNGLKGRYAPPAESLSPLCAGRIGRFEWHVLPALCQKSPTSLGAAALATDERLSSTVQHCAKIQLVKARQAATIAREALISCALRTPKGDRSLPAEGAADKSLFASQRLCFVVVQACGADAAGSSPIEPSNALEASSEGRSFAGPIAGISSGRHHKAPSSARSAALTQVRGRMSSEPFTKAMPHMTPAARPCAGTAANRQANRPCDWPTKRAPGSSNAPSLTRSRPTVLFLRWKLAGTTPMSGVSGSTMREVRQIAARL